MRGKLTFFLAGAISAFLLDPSSGGERRKWVNERLGPVLRLLGQTKERATTGDLRQRAGEVAQQASAQVTPVAHSVQQAMGTVQSKVSDAAGTIGGSISQVLPVGRATTDQPQLDDQVTPVRVRKEAQGADAGASQNGGQQATASTSSNQSTAARVDEGTALSAETAAAEVAPAPVPDPIPEGDFDERHPTETINDPTLVARVESELFRDQELPKGKLNIDATHGVVTIRGTLDEETAADIIERTRAVEGVRDVVDMLQRE